MALQNNSIMPMREYLSKTLYIPNYQREYSWDENQLDDFWTDLLSSVGENDTHFFGQIVIHDDTEKGKKYVIDGQQRTITSSIFLRALFKIYSENSLIKDMVDADTIRNDISGLIGRKTRNNNTLHLVLGEADMDYFRDHIQTGYPDFDHKSDKKSQEKMRKAFIYFYNHINEQISDKTEVDDILDCLEDMFNAFREKFVVLYMEATKLNEAFIIFETLNARGKDLETADLLKNYVFSHSTDIASAQRQWKTMIGDLDGTDPTKYIRHFWNANYAFAREKELYKKIVNDINTPRKSADFLNKITTYAPLYHDLANPEDISYLNDVKLIDSLTALKTMKASSFYPVFLAMYTANPAFSEHDAALVAASIENYVFRNFAIGGKVANRAETFFAKVAKNIYDGILADVDSIINCIKKEMLSDDEFSSQLKLWKASNSASDKNTVRYIFRKIHSFICPTSEVVLDNNCVHIEHIMPQNRNQWQQISQENHEEYLWRLGNLALLDATLNKEAQNKPFASKRQYFVKSQIKPNDWVAAKSSWGIQEIQERQEKLTEYALQIWK